MSGGGSYDWKATKTYNELLKETITEEQLAEFKQEVNQYLAGQFTNINDQRTSEIQQHLDTIQAALEKEIDGELKLLFGGSISKNTYVNGISDVDMLVVLNKSELRELSPDKVKEYFARRLEERLPSTEIIVGKLAVTVKFSSTGHEIQLLPAVSTEKGIKISKASENEWSDIIRPKEFARKLTEINSDCGGRVVPTIKLIKTINSNLSEEDRLSGYHIESLAIDAFKSYRGKTDYLSMLQHFVNLSKSAVLSPIKDRTGQSLHVDEYLGSENSSDRQRVSIALERLLNRMKKAETQMSTEQWKEMVEGN